MPVDTSLGQLARSEVNDLHAFFQSWYRGNGAATLDRVVAALAEDFELVSPSDERVSRTLLLAQLSAERGAYPDLSISIQHIATRQVSSDAVSLEYIEQHVENGQVDRRACCAVLRRYSAALSSVQWVSIYERRAA